MRTLHINLYGAHESVRQAFGHRVFEALDAPRTPVQLLHAQPSVPVPAQGHAGRAFTLCAEQYRRQALLNARVAAIVAVRPLGQVLLE